MVDHIIVDHALTRELLPGEVHVKALGASGPNGETDMVASAAALEPELAFFAALPKRELLRVDHGQITTRSLLGHGGGWFHGLLSPKNDRFAKEAAVLDNFRVFDLACARVVSQLINGFDEQIPAHHMTF